MNIRTALALVLTLSLAACTLMGVAAATAEATDAATGAGISINTVTIDDIEAKDDILAYDEIWTVDVVFDNYELYGNTNAIDGKVAAIWYGTYEMMPRVVTVTTDAVITLAPEELMESTAEIKEAAVTLAWEKIVGGIDFELYGKVHRHVIQGSVSSLLGTDGCTGLFGNDIDTVTLYNFNNPEDM